MSNRQYWTRNFSKSLKKFNKEPKNQDLQSCFYNLRSLFSSSSNIYTIEAFGKWNHQVNVTSNYPHNFHISWFQIDNCVLQRPQSILLFESIRVLWMLLYPASQPNHISFRKLYFNEFVANVLHDHFCFGSQKHHVSVHTLALQLNVCFISQCQFCLPNIHQEMRSLSASIQSPYLKF